MKNYYVVSLVATVLLTGAYSFYQFSPKDNNIVSNTQTSDTTVSAKSVLPLSGIASVFAANSRVISWETTSFPSNAGVNINLLKKISDSPIEYTLVKNIATNTANDGQETWNATTEELNSGLFIEVTCSAIQTPGACAVVGQPIEAL
jgi:hypothetical protein